MGCPSGAGATWKAVPEHVWPDQVSPEQVCCPSLARLRPAFAQLSVDVRFVICKGFTSHIKGAMGKRGEQRPPRRPADTDGPSHGGRVHGGGAGKTPFPVHEHVGRRLKEMFDEVTTQPIPDKFVKLLQELEDMQSGQPPQEPTESSASESKRKPGKSM
jgi:Anti-sigma factor NepR